MSFPVITCGLFLTTALVFSAWCDRWHPGPRHTRGELCHRAAPQQCKCHNQCHLQDPFPTILVPSAVIPLLKVSLPKRPGTPPQVPAWQRLRMQLQASPLSLSGGGTPRAPAPQGGVCTQAQGPARPSVFNCCERGRLWGRVIFSCVSV